MKLNSFFEKIESGIQVGKRFSFIANNEICWSSVGLQKWKGKYKVYIDEILESKMASEEYQREELLEFEHISEAISYIERNTKIKFYDLTPCKGQRIFNPNFV